MGKIIAAMASSHAYTFLEPKTWDKRREHTRSNYKKDSASSRRTSLR
jgi:hypothetical protein